MNAQSLAKATYKSAGPTLSFGESPLSFPTHEGPPMLTPSMHMSDDACVHALITKAAPPPKYCIYNALGQCPIMGLKCTYTIVTSRSGSQKENIELILSIVSDALFLHCSMY